MKLFSPSHQWVEVENNSTIAKVGISQFAAKELGEVVYVELPKVGDYLQLGEEAVILESTKAATDISTPLSGKVIAINRDLLTFPGKVSESPEGEGWLFQIEVGEKRELSTLLTTEEYSKQSVT